MVGGLLLFFLKDKVDNWISTTAGTDICDRIVSKSLEQLYDLLFSNSNFYFNFQKDRGTTELDIGNWEEDEAWAWNFILKLHSMYDGTSSKIALVYILQKKGLFPASPLEIIFFSGVG